MKTIKKASYPLVLQGIILILLFLFLSFGTFWKFPSLDTDIYIYQCDAELFWHGSTHLAPDLQKQCSFMLNNKTIFPFHHLPQEYPLLALIPFTLGLTPIFPTYRINFAVMMFIFVVVTYFLLQRKSNKSSYIFALLLGIGAAGTALGRFDIMPSLLTLLAFFSTQKKYWGLSFFLLAVAIWFKFYPVVLLPFFTLQLWRERRNISPLILFFTTNLLLLSGSLFLNSLSTLSPLNYFANRPIQIESTAASLAWLGKFLGFPIQMTHAFGSLNITTPLFSMISISITLFLIISYLIIFYLQYAKRITFMKAILLSLMALIIFSKVFSPQYLIWIFPFIALSSPNKRKLGLWILIACLTTVIFPYFYFLFGKQDFTNVFIFNLVIGIRNLLLFCLFVAYSSEFFTKKTPSANKLRQNP